MTDYRIGDAVRTPAGPGSVRRNVRMTVPTDYTLVTVALRSGQTETFRSYDIALGF